MEIWSHAGVTYQVVSGYSLPDNAWQYELSGNTGPGPHLAVVVPDATPNDGPFTPMDVDHVVLVVSEGVTPWPILARLVILVESSGDIVNRRPAGEVAADELLLCDNAWMHGRRRFEVNSFHHGDKGYWCYELYEAPADPKSNDFVEVRIPDVQPAEHGPVIPAPTDRAILTAHGKCSIPWPVFGRFIAMIQGLGGIAEKRIHGFSYFPPVRPLRDK